MQIPADPDDAAALEEALAPGQDRRFSHLLEFDWDQDGAFGHALSDLSGAATSVVDTSALDDSTAGAETIPSGVVAGELEIALSGLVDTGGGLMPAAELLAPYNTASPLYQIQVPGTRVRWTLYTHTSRGPIPVQQFTGRVDQRKPRRVGNEVTLLCLDAVALLSHPAGWPPWAVDGPSAARVGSTAPQRAIASSVVDHLCNSAGLLTRPRPPWEAGDDVHALVWLPLTGSFAPSCGRMYSIAPWGSSFLFPELYPTSPGLRPDGQYWTTGRFGLCRNVDPDVDPGSIIYTPRDSMPVWSGRSTSITAWVYCGPTAAGWDDDPSSGLRPPLVQVHYGFGITTDYYAYRLTLATDGVDLQIQVENGTSTLRYGTHTPAGDDWRHVHAELDHTSGVVRAKLIVDGTEVVNFSGSGGSTTTAPVLNPLFLPAEGIRLHPCALVSDVMAWQQDDAPTVTPERTHTAGAVIDPGRNEITHLPPPTGSCWDVIQAVAAAEYAAVTVDPTGVLRFRNRLTARPSEASFTLTLASASDVATTDTTAGGANAVRVTAQPGQATWARAFELATVDQIIGTPGVTTWVLPTGDDVLVPETGTVPRLCQSAESEDTAPVWSDKVDSGWVFVYDGTETEELTNQSLVNTSDQTGLDDGQSVRIEVENTSTQTGRFRLKRDDTSGTDPQPALRIGGLVRVLTETETLTSLFPAAIDAEGRQITFDLGQNPWHQHLPSVEATGRFGLRRSSRRIPTFSEITTRGDPRREVTDGCLLELGGSGQRVVAFVGGITREFQVSGGEGVLTDRLLVRATHAPGKWALGDPVLGVLGSTAVL